MVLSKLLQHKASTALVYQLLQKFGASQGGKDLEGQPSTVPLLPRGMSRPNSHCSKHVAPTHTAVLPVLPLHHCAGFLYHTMLAPPLFTTARETLNPSTVTRSY